MRLFERLERSFVANVVGRTKQLVGGPEETSEKVERLKALATHYERRAAALRRLCGASTAPERREKIAKLIGMRDKAVGYLRATQDYLLDRDRHPNSLRQMPLPFAAPAWRNRA